MCFVFISEQTATCAPYNIKSLVFITGMKSVDCGVRTGSLSKDVCASSVNGFNLFDNISDYLLRIQVTLF